MGQNVVNRQTPENIGFFRPQDLADSIFHSTFQAKSGKKRGMEAVRGSLP